MSDNELAMPKRNFGYARNNSYDSEEEDWGDLAYNRYDRSSNIKVEIEPDWTHPNASLDIWVQPKEPWRLTYPFAALQSDKVTKTIFSFTGWLNGQTQILQELCHDSRAYAIHVQGVGLSIFLFTPGVTSEASKHYFKEANERDHEHLKRIEKEIAAKKKRERPRIQYDRFAYRRNIPPGMCD